MVERLSLTVQMVCRTGSSVAHVPVQHYDLRVERRRSGFEVEDGSLRATQPGTNCLQFRFLLAAACGLSFCASLPLAGLVLRQALLTAPTDGTRALITLPPDLAERPAAQRVISRGALVIKEMRDPRALISHEPVQGPNPDINAIIVS
ncbi:hypothetical protein [Terracoccus sp. 273MFTsu3.1]|uniref:hypothetical protein n=1 Tax=Terracoccus sp. 273MFTsu3.1 TaxID=1172188 RepID=UPI0003740533|nr:hypothetical protein [Terracoccus sp. 273MFTsu3.1]